MVNTFPKDIATAAFAFRGYNVTNLGKTPELLEHAAYGSILERYLREASAICESVTSQHVYLVRRVRQRRDTTLRSYAQALSLIVGVELAQIELLSEFFGVSYTDAQMATGYSLGEVSALVAGGMYSMETVLTPLLTLARDAAELARDTTMGVLFSRGPALDFEAVERKCLEITNQGKGTIAISTYLSPNTVLLLGQQRTIGRFQREMHSFLKKSVHLKKNPHRWPPMHTPITRQRNIPDRASVILETLPGGFSAPQPRVLSCVTGDFSYNDYNSREILNRWVDHPLRLWDVLNGILAENIETVIHVGPQPNIIPSTFARLSNNIAAQLNGSSLMSLGLRAISRITRNRPWLSNLISNDATLLRAPFVQHILLEDWLLEQKVP